MADAVEACMPLRIRADDVPERPGRVRGIQHLVAGTRVLVPLTAGFEVSRAQLPLPQRILDAGLEAPRLLRLIHLEPVLDQPDAVVDHKLLKGRAKAEEFPMLLVGAEAQHLLHARATVVT